MQSEGGIMPDETPDPRRGKGDTRDLVSRREKTLHLSCLERAVYGGWDIPAPAAQAAPAFLMDVMNDPNMDTRTRVRAVEVMAALSRDRVDATVQLDRIYRLEDGTATERVEITADMPEGALEAVARSIAGVAPAEPSKPCQKPKRKP